MKCLWDHLIKQHHGQWKVSEDVANSLDRVWQMQEILTDENEYSKEFESMIHKTIKKVTNDIEENEIQYISSSAFMTMVNEFTKSKKKITRAEYKTFYNY